MISAAASTKRYSGYSIGAIREEAFNLVETGVISLHQPLRILCEYLPTESWKFVERELERNDYLLRDRVIDLLGALNWDSD